MSLQPQKIPTLEKQKDFLQHDIAITLPFLFTRLISIVAGYIVHSMLELIFLNIILFSIAKMIIKALQRGYLIVCQKIEQKNVQPNLDDTS
ncbi:MAG: hypothetical protein COU32_02115 [Candidatus Magasanikbacteria bacterium CG10_big_fil_rev_8_21_14_0_10_42_10]|uniref:Uncharacterized protein n=1 Tax=Candidatus Magasanikbacteria bacterium CG10_big_fil_rev_8_21_14_0_10_42_10 TaxID=1974649 RepID=A0A2H0TWB7_9BACT|nr:MAG: hypothetical protein COU32_02115 [Candidatus Magasanikbacteria bacterium CG10_big_fil_rev_8_21_14_0_10_42_10]